MIPDAEALVSQYLRDQDSIEALVDERVYTALPKSPEWPLLMVRRVSGAPVTSRPLHLDAAVLQLDAYAETKKQAQTLVETARSELAELEGTHDLGVVSGVLFGPMSWLPDGDYTPAKPRYVADVTVFVHP